MTASQSPSPLLILSRAAPGVIGGLAAYQRHLADALRQRGLAETTFLGPEIPRHPRWPTLASRPRFHGLLERWIEAICRPEIEAAARGGFRAVHFVGTGWDFIGFAARAAARRSGARFTVWPAVHPWQWGDDRIDLRLYNEADAVFVQSRHEAAHLERLGLAPGRAVLCGLPPMCRADGCGERLRARLELGRRPVALFLGARSEAKGYPTLLRAWPLVLEQCPEAVLLLAGPGKEDEAEAASLLAALAPGSVRDLGIPGEEEKADAYAACDLFCLPSAHESFGIVYTEAWSYGKPVLCGPAPAPREWVRDGETGLHCAQTPESVAGAMLRLLRDPAECRRMGEAGRAFQKSHLTWDGVTASHAAAFGLPASS